MTTEIKERIVKYSKELRLPTFRGEFEVHASEAAKQEASYEEYLLGLMGELRPASSLEQYSGRLFPFSGPRVFLF
jgi:hypothetical protein